MQSAPAKVLVIEDDAKTAQALARGLAREGYTVRTAFTGPQGEALRRQERFDLVVLDWLLPGRDGIQILRALRAAGERVPVLLLTAKDAVEDRVLGLDAGADDYLVKPFAFAELLARLRALLRRKDAPDALRQQVGNLTVDLEKRLVHRGSREIPLTPREFDLLAYLARHQGQTVTRQMLAQDVWRELHRATPLDNVIDVHVAHLRRKIDDDSQMKLIHTVRGVGFRLSKKPAP